MVRVGGGTDQENMIRWVAILMEESENASHHFSLRKAMEIDKRGTSVISVGRELRFMGDK